MLHLNFLFVETPKLGFSFPAGFTVSIALCFQIESESAEWVIPIVAVDKVENPCLALVS